MGTEPKFVGGCTDFRPRYTAAELNRAVAEAVAAERERCAAAAEKTVADNTWSVLSDLAHTIAARIRSGEQP